MSKKAKSIVAIVFFALTLTALGYFIYYLLSGLFWTPFYSEVGLGSSLTYLLSPVLISGVLTVVFFIVFLNYKKYNRVFKKW